MSEQSNHPEVPGASENNVPQDAPIRVRIWPPILIALVLLAATLAFMRLGGVIIDSVIAIYGIPLIATVLFIIWWLAASRTPRRDRLVGLVLLIATSVAIIFSQDSPDKGAALLAIALQHIMYGTAVLLLLARWLRWPVLRWVLAVHLLFCCVGFCAMRVHSMGGDLAPVISNRWKPTAQERSEALPALEVQGTAVLPAEVGPGDWPGFRGALRDARVTGVRFSTDWSTPPREVWRRDIGPAWSSFTAVGDYLFTQEQRGTEELVACYYAATGEPVWQNRVEGKFEDGMGLGPRATPTFIEGKLYTQGCTGIVQCLDASTGNTIWQRDLTKDAETGLPTYGFASSPLVVGELVITFSCGGEDKSVVAYNRATGDVVWRAGHKASAYSSPHLAVIEEIPQLLMVSGIGIQSFVPETGAPLWEHLWKAKMPRCVQPFILDNKFVMFGATGISGSCLLQIEKKEDAWTVEEKWLTKKFRPYFNDGVFHNNYFYGYDGERVICVDIKNGDRLWRGKRYGGQLLLIADIDMLLVLSEDGDVVLIPATPEQFSEAARFKALTGKTWAYPTIAHGKLFVRNSQEAACFELPGFSPQLTKEQQARERIAEYRRKLEAEIEHYPKEPKEYIDAVPEGHGLPVLEQQAMK